jgi:crotonobetainyl-CoA:carnitine CoA-transferase CaiB-like acyl-CoA transferase
MASPLQGITVLDLTRLLPGAFATLMLAELGAEVIKIEDPATGGDPMRHLPPVVNGRGIYDLLLNRGKKSVALDLRQPEARTALDHLSGRADIVVESFRPATARRLGVSADVLGARHPRLIHCAITGYGQTGPYAEVPGHDLNYVSVSGFLAADRPSLSELPHMFIADIGGGAMSAVIGILAALVGRGRDGEGRSLDISMHEAALYWVMLPAARELVDGGASAVGELPTFGRHASYNIYRSRDGQALALGALEPKFWRAFCQAVGRPDLAARHASGPDDQAALIETMRELFAARTRDEWLGLLQGRDVCVTPVNDPAAALVDPHIRARGTVTAAAGLRAIRPPFLTETPTLRPAPELGQDTKDVLG